MKTQEPKQEKDYTALLQPVGTKQETLEEAAERFIKKQNFNSLEIDDKIFEAILFGAKWQQEQIGKSDFLQKLRGTLSDAEARRLIFEQFKKK